MQIKAETFLPLVFFSFFLFAMNGCGPKKYRTPSVPAPLKKTKIFEDKRIKVEQGEITGKDLEYSLNGDPTEVLGVGVHIENKSKKPVVIEIERTNVGTYDAEDLALLFSKIALENPRIKELTIGHDISQALTIGITGALSAATAYGVFRELQRTAREQADRFENHPSFNNNWTFSIISILTTIPLIAIGSYVYGAINAEKTNIIESEQERLIEQFRQMFEPAILAFDDCIEIAPESSLDQVIFYDTKPVTADAIQQRQLVLRCASDGTKTLIPLEL